MEPDMAGSLRAERQQRIERSVARTAAETAVGR
jgi:hypothetical protein